MRREFSKAVKIAAWQRADGHCENCGMKLWPGKYRYDHDIPDQLGGEPTLDNCVVRCLACDGEKTYSEDIPRIAKAKRQQVAHIGAKQSRTPMPGSRMSRWKKRMDGTVVRR